MDRNLVSRNFITKTDFIVIMIIVLIGCIMILINTKQNVDGNLSAVVTYNGEQIYNIDLENVNEPYNLVINENENLVLTVENGRIRYLSSNCPDQICVNSGWLDNYGDFAACAPFRSTISLEGNTVEDKPDFMLN